LTEHGSNRDPAWSPDGRRIAFSSDRGASRQVWTMNADGSGQAQLSGGEYLGYQPAWSPGGDAIAYAHYGKLTRAIYVMAADGSDIRRLSPLALREVNEAPAWRPETKTGVPMRGPGQAYWHEWRASKTDPRIRLPFLVRFERPEIEAAVNREMQTVLDGQGCGVADERLAARMYWNTTARVTYADRDVFSVDVVTEHDCGGPYPTNAAQEPITFDLRTGRRVALADLFAAYGRDKDAIVRALFGAHVGDAAPAGDACPEKWSLADLEVHAGPYYVEPGGIVVTPEFPHALEACSFQEHVPLARLRAWAAPNGILARLE
jgi:hypothetical protein